MRDGQSNRVWLVEQGVAVMLLIVVTKPVGVPIWAS